MLRRIAVIAALVACCSVVGAQTAPATTQPAGLSDDQLLAIFQKDLGKSFDAGKAVPYLAAHHFIESYFTTPGTKDRAAIVRQLELTGLDANVLGRLTRVRRAWHELDAGVYFINDSFGQYEVKYFLGIPAGYSPLTATPLVIVLPTADAFLANPPPDNAGVTKIYQDWMTEELARHRDAIVLMPLLNLDELYGPGRIGMNGVIQAMQHAADQVNIDPQRVYLMGHSMGAHAVWNLALHYPTYFAAMAPMAGAASADWQRLRLMNLRNILPVIWQDSDDAITQPDPTRSLVRILRGMKFDVEYTETKNLGHTPPSRIVNAMAESIRARSRDLYPKEVLIQSNKPETIFNRADWVQIYQPLRPGEEIRLRVTHGTGPMIANQNTCNVKAIFANNKITATTDNVLLLRFYVNDQMVDFSRAVNVVINGKTRVETFVKPSIDEMLKDQVFMGRGWRYYTGVIDVDLTGGTTTRPATRP